MSGNSGTAPDYHERGDTSQYASEVISECENEGSVIRGGARTFLSNAARICGLTTTPSSCPEGTFENSPAFQRWGGRRTRPSPEGTAEGTHSFGRPFGTQSSLRSATQ